MTPIFETEKEQAGGLLPMLHWLPARGPWDNQPTTLSTTWASSRPASVKA